MQNELTLAYLKRPPLQSFDSQDHVLPRSGGSFAEGYFVSSTQEAQNIGAKREREHR